MAEESPPRNESLHFSSRVNTLLMFGEGATFFLNSFAADGSTPDPSPDSDRAALSAFFFFRELWNGERSLPVVRSLFRPQKIVAARGSLTDYTCESGVVHCSTTMQSGTRLDGV